MKNEVTIEQEKLSKAMKRIKFLEEKLMESVTCSEALDKELQIASRSIVSRCIVIVMGLRNLIFYIWLIGSTRK